MDTIKSDEHLAEGQRVIDELSARGKLNSGEEIYLEALSHFVASDEDEQHAIERASDAEMLRHLTDAKTVTQIQLSRARGSPSPRFSRFTPEKNLQPKDDSRTGKVLSRRCRCFGGEYLNLGKTEGPEVSKESGVIYVA